MQTKKTNHIGMLLGLIRHTTTPLYSHRDEDEATEFVDEIANYLNLKPRLKNT